MLVHIWQKKALGGTTSFRHRPRRDKFSSRDRRHDGFTRNIADEDGTVRSKTPRVVIDEADATTIFIGIGRNRHVFPRDLVGLIAQVVQLDRERIGTIKVLENYSFVQLYKDDADRVINTLNGYDYRGRKLAVSFSRKRDDIEDEKFSSDDYDSQASVDENLDLTLDSSSTESSSDAFLV